MPNGTLQTDHLSSRRLRSKQRSAKQQSAPTRRVLFISYTFPPVGGAGVQRAAKFVKYLPDFGWQPTVVTVANPSVPLMDSSHLDEIADSTRVIRIPTWEPSYGAKKSVIEESRSNRFSAKRLIKQTATALLQPDPQVLWCWPAIRKLRRLVSREAFDAVMVTGPPFSTFEMARKIAKFASIPLILDFRDEWELSVRHLENQSRTHRLESKQRTLFIRALEAADAIVATTKASQQRIQSLVNERGLQTSVRTIYNGFDPCDFQEITSNASNSTRFRLSYNGTLWNLTDVTPLIRSVQHLSQENPALCGSLEIEFIGRRTPDQQSLVDSLKQLPCHLIEHDYLPHHASLRRAKSADALCLLLADRMGAERVVPAKLFEYFALGRPVLNIGPRGEAAELLKESGNRANYRPNETHLISNWLADQIRRKLETDGHSDQGEPEPSASRSDEAHLSNDLDWCKRHHLTKQLATVLTDTIVKSTALKD